MARVDEKGRVLIPLDRTIRNASSVTLIAGVASAIYAGYLLIEISRVVVRGFFQVEVPLY